MDPRDRPQTGLHVASTATSQPSEAQLNEEPAPLRSAGPLAASAKVFVLGAYLLLMACGGRDSPPLGGDAAVTSQRYNGASDSTSERPGFPSREEVIPRTPPKRGIHATCDAGPPERPAGTREVLVYFHCAPPGEVRDQQTAPVRRAIRETTAILEATLRELAGGPTPKEQDVGFYSPFSARTRNLLKGVKLEGGVATVDFSSELRRLDNIGTTGVSSTLYQELNETIFQFSTVSSIVYTLDGSAEAWCELHGADCAPVRR